MTNDFSPKSWKICWEKKSKFHSRIYRSNKKTFYSVALRYFVTLLGRPSKGALPHPVSARVFCMVLRFERGWFGQSTYTLQKRNLMRKTHTNIWCGNGSKCLRQSLAHTIAVFVKITFTPVAESLFLYSVTHIQFLTHTHSLFFSLSLTHTHTIHTHTHTHTETHISFNVFNWVYKSAFGTQSWSSLPPWAKDLKLDDDESKKMQRQEKERK